MSTNPIAGLWPPGRTSVREPRDESHGDRMGGVIDPVGGQWWMATPIGLAGRSSRSPSLEGRTCRRSPCPGLPSIPPEERGLLMEEDASRPAILPVPDRIGADPRPMLLALTVLLRSPAAAASRPSTPSPGSELGQARLRHRRRGGRPLRLSRPGLPAQDDRVRGRADRDALRRARARARDDAGPMGQPPAHPRDRAGSTWSSTATSGRPRRAERYLATRPYYIYQLQMMAPKGGPARSFDDLTRPRPDGRKWRVGVLGGSAPETYATSTAAARSRSSPSPARPTR